MLSYVLFLWHILYYLNFDKLLQNIKYIFYTTKMAFLIYVGKIKI